ncbi:MAG: hypothetical protein COW11_03645 [Candidatus Omnitrophica bacterium CG12_big_fil_rev_8_21_14_0_65_43_15]|uniref:Uncharacterized protein n=1 Tax=Candidatus Taenaricola geysiri TaxID=1974752 RepID=A0A2J0LGP9_9BACT|nr:MAG: hypothetical protein AUJ89_03165 [Candidatus Omnitrophica bacterium CG1_02_43_210]PIV12045.1 MAG: hypothetical protein COS48_02790 [Candidatus Omnitrophica bacterium CG03_land_8_20_14_0_80_43_22]PIW66379.1 MAG: hypothetical protein COW11_03645 [Candidatus Omnitrophica bacterium CG12_big_fil_rev_8_21_14_0_65_43_15]PIW79855.1 MAG: hypothetical protein COZ98_05385 [Candidatus Omnitrophica bacterium CG_4_8_14_3_um_filter_43_15]PIY84403.1 MAG: hypothetical protein COY77_02595 [Candidatus Omn
MNYPRTSKAMDEVHKWREDIHNDIVNMCLEEKLNYFHKASEKICAKFGLKRLQLKHFAI